MAFCPNCGKETAPTDRFCLNCGANLDRLTTTPNISPPFQLPPTQPPSAATSKNPWLAAILNFFLPGTGYIYNGIGRSTSQLIFGFLVFIFYFVGYDVSFVGLLLSLPATPTPGGATSPFDFLILLVFLLPFAFAYDGYKRAQSN